MKPMKTQNRFMKKVIIFTKRYKMYKNKVKKKKCKSKHIKINCLKL